MLGALVSQAISRKLSRLSFYEEILEQDGHHLERVVPPRDLQSWQQLPLSAVANFGPVVADDLAPAGLERLLRAHPYQRFPALRDGALGGILTRKEAELAISGKATTETGACPYLPAASNHPRAGRQAH